MKPVALVCCVMALAAVQAATRPGDNVENVQNVQAEDRVRTQSLGVSENLYLVSGGGGNALMMAADTGVVVVDTKSPGQGRILLDIADGISERAITTAIYTHAHIDHTGGSRALPGLQQIVAHERTRTIMAAMNEFQGDGARFLPGTVFQDTITIGEGRDRIDLYHFGAAHTSGDIVVVFPAKRVTYFGDLFPGKRVPVVDHANGGSFLAWPDTLTRAIVGVPPGSRIVPGHGVPPPGSPVGRWITMADLQEYATFTRDFLAAVQEDFTAGKTPETATTALQLRDRYPAYNFDQADAAVRGIYGELAARR